MHTGRLRVLVTGTRTAQRLQPTLGYYVTAPIHVGLPDGRLCRHICLCIFIKNLLRDSFRFFPG